MSSIVTGILSSTVGLLLNKARDKTADKLRDGDITDARIREIIVRELNDVQAKIDGLSRSYLLTSYNFLQEGVNLLKTSLDKSEEKQKAILDETHGAASEKSAKPRDVESVVLSEALTLSQTMGKVKINSDRELETAKKRFEDARRKATEAFCNEALRTKDRIFAAKLRIISELLEFLDSPETAMTNCLPFLEMLHSLPAIREMFSVYINGGVRSKVKKAERVEIVKSVMLINYVLFRYAEEFGCKYCSPTNWPTIELADRSFRPILDWQEVSTRKSWGKELIQPPNEVILDKKIDYYISAVNSHGEIIVVAKDGNINVTSKAGEVKMVELNYPGDEVIEQVIIGLAVDSNNNVYVLTYLETNTESGDVKRNVLYGFDENYNVKQHCPLHFLEAAGPYVKIAVNKNNIIVIMDSDPHVYVCDSAGELKQKFQRDTSYVRTLTTLGKNQIMLASEDLKAVHIYSENGDLESTIKVPEGHEIRSMAFHHVICKILVLTLIRKSSSYFLLCYSETGELQNSRVFCKEADKEYPVIRSHPSGPIAVVRERIITFI